MRARVSAVCVAVVVLCSSSSAAQTPSSPPASQPASIESLRTACAARNGAACDELGRRYMSGEGVPVDHGRASEALANACSYGDGLGCSRLGFIYEAGRGVTADAGRAAALYALGCDRGAAWGCTRSGLMFANGRGVEKSDTRAVEYYRRACDGGDGAGCSNLGMMHQTGRGVAPDDARSVALFKVACDRSDGIGCAHLALMYDLGLGTARDEAAAIALYTRACDLGGGSGGCLMLGHKYANGRGVARDDARALSLFQRGCQDGEPNACTYAADPARARAAAPGTAPTPAATANTAAPAAPPTSMIFPTSQAEIIWHIKPGRARDFEAAWKKLADSLARSGENTLRQAARSMTTYRVTAGILGYVVRLDPVIAGLSYQPGTLLDQSAALSKQERDAVYAVLAETTTTLSWLALEEVRLRGTGVRERVVPDSPGAAALGRTGDPLNWAPLTTDRAEILFVVKPGQQQAFEQVWQEIVPAMERSPNARLRQAAREIGLLKSVDPLSDGALTYVLRIDRVIEGIKYDPPALLNGLFVKADADELHAKLSAAVDSANVLSLAIVD